MGFDLPEIGRLTHIGRSMNTAQCRKVVAVMTTKVEKHAFVRADAQKRTDDLNGQHFTVIQRRFRSSLPQFHVVALKPIINVRKHCNDKRVNIHFGDLHYALDFGDTSSKRMKVSISYQAPKHAHGISYFVRKSFIL